MERFIQLAPGAGSLFWFEIPFEPSLSELPQSSPPKKAALICSVERGRDSAAAVLAASGFDRADPDTAEWIFVDAEQEKARSGSPVDPDKKIIAFGAGGLDVAPRRAAVIGGALTPGRLARALESLEQAESSREGSAETAAATENFDRRRHGNQS